MSTTTAINTTVAIEGAQGVTVEFPFKPYSVQVEIVQKTLSGLLEGGNVMIESPTGTGKTMALLCAASAFVLEMKQRLQRSSAVMGLMLPGTAPTGGGGGGGAPTRRRIVYASRTHAQLTQVVREFKACPYSRALTMAVLASREHLCVQSNVNNLPNSTAMNAACNALRSDRGCRYFHGVSRFMAEEQMSATCNAAGGDEAGGGGPAPPGLHDIEELGNLGRGNGFCPYFYEREMAATADIIFLPYSYVFEASLAAQLPFTLDSSCALILDEAHNVPSYLASAKCLSLSPKETGSAVTECTRAYTAIEETLKSAADGTNPNPMDQGQAQGLRSELDDISALKLFLVRLEGEIVREQQLFQQLPTTTTTTTTATTSTSSSSASMVPLATEAVEIVRPGKYMKQFLGDDRLRLDTNTWRMMQEVITRAMGRLNENGAPTFGLNKVQDFFSSVFIVPDEELVDEHQSAYRFVMFPFKQDGQQGGGFRQQQQHQQKQQQPGIKSMLGFWCLDSSVGMRDVLSRVSCAVLASGTLSPMPHFAAELGATFRYEVQGNHVIGEDQLLSIVARKGPSGTDLNSSYAMRSNAEYSAQLGMTLVNLCRSVPDGVIVFFPSYAAMNGAIEVWKNRRIESGQPGFPAAPVPAIGTAKNAAQQQQQQQQQQQVSTVWGLMTAQKPVMVEPRDTAEGQAVVKEYRRAVDEGKGRGAMLLAVCRGKVSEGIDFADRHGRAVVVTGLPFAHHGDLFVRLKKQHITAVSPHRPKVYGKPFTGEDWYKNEALRAVNQALGRVIRHKDDYGAVILADERFGQHQQALSKWVRAGMKICNQFADTMSRVEAFFQGWHKKELERKQARQLEMRKAAAVASASGGGGGGGGGGFNDDDDIFSSSGGGDSALNGVPAAAAMAADAAMALRERQRQQHQQQQQPTVQDKLAGTQQGDPAIFTDAPAPAALRRGSMFQKVTPKASSSSSSSSSGAAPRSLASAAVQRQQQQHQQQAVVAQQQQQQPANPTAVFCDRLKALISADVYAVFRAKLVALLQLARKIETHPAAAGNGGGGETMSTQDRETFKQIRTLIMELQEGVFNKIEPRETSETVTRDFGCFLPEKLRPFYSELTRRRQR